MKRLVVFIVIFFSSSLSSLGFAETIILKNGKEIKVDSLRLEGKTVVGKISGGEIRFHISKIKEVKKSNSISSRVSPRSLKTNEQKDDFSESRKIAYKAYKHAAGNPFNAQARAEAVEILNRARAIDPNEAEIFLTEAVMILQDGYRHGPWYKAWAYNPGVVDLAINRIENAVSSDPNYYRSYTMLAWMYIVRSEYHRAEEFLAKSYSLKKDSFYYWLYKGTLSQEKKEYDKALEYYDIAEGHATDDSLLLMIKGRRKNIARDTGDLEQVEQYYLDEIEEDPDSAYSYGNYAGFLLCTGRFKEAIPYYEKAISIKPYPKVMLGLTVAKMGNKEAAKCKNNQIQI